MTQQKEPENIVTNLVEKASEHAIHPEADDVDNIDFENLLLIANNEQKYVFLKYHLSINQNVVTIIIGQDGTHNDIEIIEFWDKIRNTTEHIVLKISNIDQIIKIQNFVSNFVKFDNTKTLYLIYDNCDFLNQTINIHKEELYKYKRIRSNINYLLSVGRNYNIKTIFIKNDSRIFIEFAIQCDVKLIGKLNKYIGLARISHFINQNLKTTYLLDNKLKYLNQFIFYDWKTNNPQIWTVKIS